MPQGSPYPEASWGYEFDPGSESYCDETWASFISTDHYRAAAQDMEPYPLFSVFPTAASKQNTLSSGFDQSEWSRKPVKQWTGSDSMSWVINVVSDHGRSDYEDLNLRNFDVDGLTLYSWCKEDFTSRDLTFGSLLYDALQTQLNEEKTAYSVFNLESGTLPPFPTLQQQSDRLSPPFGDDGHYTELRPLPNHDSGSEQSDGFTSSKYEDSIPDPIQVKKKRGRPVGNRSKRKTEKKCGRLWEFIRDLLLKPEYCPSLICWENHDEGVFRFVRSDKVAELWGTIKENPKMTYEKLSRAMRYYYKSKVLQPVFGRRLVYKFGPTAKGWRTDNPNFRQPIPCE